MLQGGELFDAIVANEHYSEQDASRLIRQIVHTIEYVHDKNIVHRDVKPGTPHSHSNLTLNSISSPSVLFMNDTFYILPNLIVY